MFNWLKKRLALRRRNIFGYFDGQRWRYADPVVLDRYLANECPNWKTLITFLTIPDMKLPENLMKNAIADQANALKSLVETARKIFKLNPLDESGHGLTESESISVFADFVSYTGRLVDDASFLLNSPAPAAAFPSAPQPTTEPSAASTSAANASLAPNPELSPTV